MKTAALFLLALFLSILLFPQAQASSMIQKYPSQCAGDWTNGDEAYTKDSSYATAELSGSSQSEEYYGFGFNFSGSETIESVLIELTYSWQVLSWESSPDESLTLEFSLNTSTGYQVFETFSGIIHAAVTEGIAARPDNLEDESFRITPNDHNVTINELNSASLKITASTIYYYCYVYLDVVSIIVFYSAEASSGFYYGFLFGGLLVGLIAFVAILVIEKR